MTSPLSSLRGRIAAAAFAVMSLAPMPGREPVEVTRRDVAASNEKVAMAYQALTAMWTTNFRRIGERFIPPRIARYTGTAMTPCGVIRGNNAEYCPASNAIYYDEVFVAGMAKVAAVSLGTTDGDMTGIGIIAHEMGHAVALQLGHRYRTSYDNEATADCLAGAFANQAAQDKSLEDGDIDEAIFGMSMAGDPTPRSTGNERFDAIIQARLARQSHGTREQRVQNFRDGFEGGPGACLEEFRSRR